MAAAQHPPMPTIISGEAYSTTTDSGSSTQASAVGSDSVSSSARTDNLRVGPRHNLLPSPPFSPQNKGEEFESRRSSEAAASGREESGHSHMLYLSSSSNDAAKLDVSHLLKTDPSPPPSSYGAEDPRGVHSRSSSVPLPQVLHAYGESSHRTTVSASSVVLPSYPVLSLRQLTQKPSLPPQASSPQQSTSSSAERLKLPPLQPPAVMLTAQAPAQVHPQQQQQHSPQLSESPYRTHQPPNYQTQQRGVSPPSVPSKRAAPAGAHPSASPAKRQSKWTPEEDALIIELRGSGMKWEEISKRLPGRSAISCRLHYQNYLERRSEWDEERKNRLARLYERLKPEMWGPLAAELGIPWRAAEAMHWQLGETDMARRAGVVPFSLATSTTNPPPYQTGPSPTAASPYVQIPPGLPVGPGGLAPPRRGSLVRRPEDAPSYAGGPSLSHARPGTSGGPPVSSGPGLLPSLAELDRGKGLYDERARAAAADASQAYYQPQQQPPPPPPPPGPPPGQGRGYPEYRR